MTLNKLDENIIIGYTTGVFDMFHIGHLNVLKEAKKQCDYLIVGVTTDELCLEVKNKKPIIPFLNRLEIIKSIKYVDQAVHQENYNKSEAFLKYNFKKMFVGDDWKGTETWLTHEKVFKEKGVEIIYLPYTKDISSSILRNKINSNG